MMTTMTRRISHYLVLVALAILFAGHMQAGLILHGDFTADDEIRFYQVNLGSPGTLTVQTFGYGGNSSLAIGGGGFDPYLSLFTQSGLLLGTNNDGTCPPLQVSGGGACFDSSLTIILPAGIYIAAISQYDNTPLGPMLADGFTRTGQGNFTLGLWGYPGTAFVDALGNQRTGSYVVSFDGATSVTESVPEPGSWVLAGWAAVLFVYRTRRGGSRSSIPVSRSARDNTRPSITG
jgi:hypothetical protein